VQLQPGDRWDPQPRDLQDPQPFPGAIGAGPGLAAGLQGEAMPPREQHWGPSQTPTPRGRARLRPFQFSPK